MDGNVPKNNDLVTKRRSLFPDLTPAIPQTSITDPVEVTEPTPAPHIDPEAVLPSQLQLSSRYDDTGSTEEPVQALPVAQYAKEVEVPLETTTETTIKPQITLKKQSIKNFVLVGVGLTALAVLGGGGYFLFHKPTPAPVIAPQVTAITPFITSTIAVYFPKNLPAGFSYNNDGKALKADIYYYTIKGPNKELFYVTQQRAASSSDFVAFNKRISSPVNLELTNGTTVAGKGGGSFISSTTTPKNTWVIINAANTTSVNDIETVVRSLSL
jgi:hypothetical protein